MQDLLYDAIVVGAGPAGCTAAKILSECGRKVLLAERFKIPRYKSCSGVLIRKSVELVKRYFGEEVPDFVTCAPKENKGMIFTDDKGREYRFEQTGLNVWRSTFDAWLAQKASYCGAELRDGTPAVSFEVLPDCVEAELHGRERVYRERARYVIDCEGVVGACQRKLLGTKPDYITTYQTFNDGDISLDPHYFYAYLQPGLSEYDAWFNVKDNRLVLGVSVKERGNIRRYYDKFLDYMRENHGLDIRAQLKEEKWLMPRISPEYRVNYGVERVLFAGEVAGFLNPMGEGISAGMESGACAAAAVDDNFEDPQKALAQYRSEISGLRTYMERQWRFVGGIAGTFSEMK